MLLIIFVNSSILDVWMGSEYVFGFFNETVVGHQSKLSPIPWEHNAIESVHCHIPWEHSITDAHLEPSQTSKVRSFADSC